MVKLHDFPDIKTEAELAKHASIAKSLAKKIIGNSLYQLSMADFQTPQDQEA